MTIAWLAAIASIALLAFLLSASKSESAILPAPLQRLDRAVGSD